MFANRDVTLVVTIKFHTLMRCVYISLSLYIFAKFMFSNHTANKSVSMLTLTTG